MVEPQDMGMPAKKKFTGLKIFAALVILSLLVLTVHISGIKATHEREVEKLQGMYLPLKQRAEKIKITRARRAQFYRTRSFLELPGKISYVAADLVRRISLIAPPGVKVKRFEVEPLERNLSFTMEVLSTASALRRFYRYLEAMEDVILLTYPGDERSPVIIRGEVVLE